MLKPSFTNDLKSDFIENLKNSTLAAHQKLESLPVSSRMMRPDVTKNQYIEYLNLMYAVVNEVECKIFPLLQKIFSDLAERCKSQLIAKDINAMDYRLDKNINPIFIIQGRSLGFLAGIIYVVEGSTLGGRYMKKNVESVLNFTDNNVTRFFGVYQNEIGTMWKTFLKELFIFKQKYNNEAEIIAGAKYAFETIYLHFKSVECEN